MISHHEAQRLANAHLTAGGGPVAAGRAKRQEPYGVWLVSFRDPAQPDEMLVGGALVVTDEGEVHEVGSTPDAVDRLMVDLGRWPRAQPPDVWAREGEALALMADLDPEEAAGLAAWAEQQHQQRESNADGGRG